MTPIIIDRIDLPDHAYALAKVVPCGYSQLEKHLVELADGHATYQAKANRQGHQNFNSRFRDILKYFKDTGQYADVHEICAETWPWMADAEPERIADDFLASWKQSKGHWSVAKRIWNYAGIGVRRSEPKRGKPKWFACIIAVDLKPMPKAMTDIAASVIRQASQPESLPHWHYWEVATHTGVGRTPGICLPRRSLL